MIQNKLVPNIDIFNKIEPTKYTDMGMGMRFKSVEQPETADFKAVLSGLVENLNNDISKPDELLRQQMMGNQNVDVHDVIIAINKASTEVQLATNVTTKLIQAYDKIMQISI
ncbi:MAG: flagellar hook-basal body complex protein FliE [Candidatus Gastranaerophilales bacterium]|nr:flagellar hook-basal body complex protein FliE [Candidatus Gastranaerophilales bacterium]